MIIRKGQVRWYTPTHLYYNSSFESGHDHENGNAPWVGYQDEAGMKEKILSLSEDKRTFIRAPPSGVTFEFEYATVAPIALAILAEDPKLEKMR